MENSKWLSTEWMERQPECVYLDGDEMKNSFAFVCYNFNGFHLISSQDKSFQSEAGKKKAMWIDISISDYEIKIFKWFKYSSEPNIASIC